MASSFRRPVNNGPRPNRWNLPHHLFMVLYFEAKREKRSTAHLLEQALYEFAARRGYAVSPDGGMATACPLCNTPLTKNSVSKALITKHIWACQYCLAELEQQREQFIQAREREAQASRGAPVPIRR